MALCPPYARPLFECPNATCAPRNIQAKPKKSATSPKSHTFHQTGYQNCFLQEHFFIYGSPFPVYHRVVDSVCQNGKVFAFAIPAALNDSHQSYTCRIESRPYSGESSRLLCAASTDFHAASNCQLCAAHRIISIATVWRCLPQFQAAPVITLAKLSHTPSEP